VSCNQAHACSCIQVFSSSCILQHACKMLCCALLMCNLTPPVTLCRCCRRARACRCHWQWQLVQLRGGWACSCSCCVLMTASCLARHLVRVCCFTLSSSCCWHCYVLSCVVHVSGLSPFSVHASDQTRDKQAIVMLHALACTAGPLLMQQLPPEVAARQAGRTLATAPPPATWLLQLLPAQGQPWTEQDAGAGRCTEPSSELPQAELHEHASLSSGDCMFLLGAGSCPVVPKCPFNDQSNPGVRQLTM
jgi:hypothetical protein